MKDFEFGIKVPSLSEEGIAGTEFITSINEYLSEVPAVFTTFWVSDHLMTWVKNQPANADALECWSVMIFTRDLPPYESRQWSPM